MSIFGQVWLWSLAAFFVGALLTWLVLVLPLRKSVRKLESALAQSHADAARTPANAAGLATPGAEGYSRSEPAYDESRYESNPYEEARPQETSYPGTLVAASPVSRDEVHDDIDADFAELDSQVPPRTPPVDDYRPEPEPDSYPASATQVMAPVAEPEQDDPYRAAASEYLSPEDDEQYEPEPAPALSQLEHQLEPDTGGSLFQPPAAAPPAPEPDWFDHEPQSQRSAFEEPMERTRYIGEHPGSARKEERREEPQDELADDFEDELPDDEAPQYAFAGDEAAGGDLDVPPETPAEATQVLPKRQPRGVVRGGFDSPQPIQPSMRTVERRDPELSGAHSGSLFEPSVQPTQTAVGVSPDAPPPPPARESAEDSVPPGPFGPGSAMPRPGGGRPSDGFEVKASVTALRYCTDESEQFPRMVAEVWFRTAEDAERVGFRPLT
ncbi:sunset domain-containing protein [Amycolatopsis sp. NBC_00438]|uniref:sunset domain-containing protein n=1 Tax=Amycolatopsis sp. NBC_00438 TaxID=2903558 RepID=UPI002E1A8A0C